MSKYDCQRLFPFLSEDEVCQRARLAKDVSVLLLDELRDLLVEEATHVAQWEVRELLPRIVTDLFAGELRRTVKQAVADEFDAMVKKYIEQEDPADWWKGDVE